VTALLMSAEEAGTRTNPLFFILHNPKWATRKGKEGLFEIYNKWNLEK